MTKYNCSDAILDLLESYEIKQMFGYPGGAIMPFYDRIPYHNIKHILVRHEQAAGFAAQGVARSTGKIGVCVATSGPGGVNVLTAVADAYMDSIPMLFITGQVFSNMMGNDMFQEVDINGMTLPITKHNYIITKATDVIPTFIEAIKIATSGRSGPVHIDIPKDIQLAEHPKNFTISNIIKKSPLPTREGARGWDEVISMLKAAKKPILLVGQGVKLSKAEKELEKFIGKLCIPTVTTLLAKGIINPNNPNYLGMLGMHGFYDANLAMANADLVINIGSRFDDRIVGTYDSFAKGKKIIHVDIDKVELNKVVKADLPINSDAKKFLNSINSSKEMTRLDIDSWRNTISDFGKNKSYEKETDFFSMKSVINSLQKVMDKNLDNYIVVTDVGQHQMFSSLNFNIKNPYNWLTSGGSGTMGFGLPTAMGAAIANPNKIVIVISGDGGIQMNIQELATIKENNLNIKSFVLNNNFLGMVRQWQELFFDKNYSETPITSPDFAMLAKSYGIDGFDFGDKDSFDREIEKILSSKGPAMINVNVEKEDNVFPMVAPGKALSETIVE